MLVLASMKPMLNKRDLALGALITGLALLACMKGEGDCVSPPEPLTGKSGKTTMLPASCTTKTTTRSCKGEGGTWHSYREGDEKGTRPGSGTCAALGFPKSHGQGTYFQR